MTEQELQNFLNQELAGRLLRVARPGDMLTQDIQPGRLTIWLDDERRISAVRVDCATQDAPHSA